MRKGDNKGWKQKYYEYLNSDAWKDIRNSLFALRGRKCERCFKDLKGKIADVHHKTYKNLYNEQFEDLEILCRKCHKKEHKNDNKKPKYKKRKRTKYEINRINKDREGKDRNKKINNYLENKRDLIRQLRKEGTKTHEGKNLTYFGVEVLKNLLKNK